MRPSIIIQKNNFVVFGVVVDVVSLTCLAQSHQRSSVVVSFDLNNWFYMTTSWSHQIHYMSFFPWLIGPDGSRFSSFRNGTNFSLPTRRYKKTFRLCLVRYSLACESFLIVNDAKLIVESPLIYCKFYCIRHVFLFKQVTGKCPTRIWHYRRKKSVCGWNQMTIFLNYSLARCPTLPIYY